MTSLNPAYSFGNIEGMSHGGQTEFDQVDLDLELGDDIKETKASFKLYGMDKEPIEKIKKYTDMFANEMDGEFKISFTG